MKQFADAGLAIIDLDEPRTPPTDAKPEAARTDDDRWFADIPTMLSLAAGPTPGLHRHT
ncbi:MAG: hypothetical protein ACRCY8_19010 [Dermatophilaceae bacterium]